MELEEAYINDVNEVTLQRKVKMPIKRLMHIFKPVYGLEKFTVKIDKVTILDQLAVIKVDFNLAPENIDSNLYFTGWLFNRLAKRADPYWEYSIKESTDMFCEQTFLELTEIWKNSNVKKKVTNQQEEQQESPLNGKK